MLRQLMYTAAADSGCLRGSGAPAGRNYVFTVKRGLSCLQRALYHVFSTGSALERTLYHVFSTGRALQRALYHVFSTGRALQRALSHVFSTVSVLERTLYYVLSTGRAQQRALYHVSSTIGASKRVLLQRLLHGPPRAGTRRGHPSPHTFAFQSFRGKPVLKCK